VKKIIRPLLLWRNRIRLILSEANPTSAEQFFWAS
jgi:hypothetical protein